MKRRARRKATLPSNQEIERYYFEMFQKIYSLPPGEIKYADKPDVIIRGTRIYGIEITNLYVEDGTKLASEQRQSGLRRDAVALAQTLYERTGGPNIEMTFSFDGDHRIRNVGAVAEGIAKLAHRVSAWPNGPIQRHHFAEIPELKFAYLYARQLQYRDEPDPKFPNGQPDPSEGFSVFAEY
jgi:hypothetical protein